MRVNITVALLIFISGCVGATASNSVRVPIEPSVVFPVEQLGKAFTSIAAHVSPAVVSVFSEKTIKFQRQDMPFPFGDEFLRQFFGSRTPQSQNRPHEYKIPQVGTGSGMLLDHDGNILTNNHLVQNVDEIQVQFADLKKMKAKVVATDARTDVAIIRIQGKGFENYPVVELGNSDAVQVGDVVLAIGAPFGLAQTVTHGIISARGRADVGLVDYEDFLQTDAPINPGNSGGPLVNSRGEIIGMNSAIASSFGQSNGVGFAIPSNMIKAMLPKMIKGESISRGELGVNIQNMTDDLARDFGLKDVKGVIVSQVISGSAAEKAGLKVEDIITRFDGKPIEEVRVLRNLVAETQPGAKINIELIRDKKPQSIILTMGKQNSESTEVTTGDRANESNSVLDRLGLTVDTLTKELSLRFRTKEATGVIVLDVGEGSPAMLAGLQVGDVIVQVNHKLVKNADQFIKIISQSKSDSTLLLTKRRGASLFVSIQLD